MDKYCIKLLDSAFAFFFVGCIMLVMGLFNWGALPKAQDNAQTIDEAIGAAIVAHESDPTAHLGDGESLQQHKNNEVIDHPALSIVPDKFSNAKNYINYSLGVVIAGTVDNAIATGGPVYLSLHQNNTYSDVGSYRIDSFIPTDIGYVDGDIIINFLAQPLGSGGTFITRFEFGFASVKYNATSYCFGVWNSVTEVFDYSGWYTRPSVDFLRMRIFYNSITNTIEFYEKDLVIYSHVGAPVFSYGEMPIEAFLERGTVADVWFAIGNLSVWLDGI